MNMRLIGLGMGVVVLASTLGACSAAQQDPQCVVAKAVSDGSTGSFAATYTLKDGQDASLACAQRSDCDSIINEQGAQVCVGIIQIDCMELGGESLACAERSDCQSIINDQGAQVCVDKPACGELSGGSLQCAERPDCADIINEQGAQVCVDRP